jgi:hypothetical protein
LAMVRILVAPDPEEALSFLSSPAHGLPFLWLFAIAKHVSNRNHLIDTVCLTAGF